MTEQSEVVGAQTLGEPEPVVEPEPVAEPEPVVEPEPTSGAPTAPAPAASARAKRRPRRAEADLPAPGHASEPETRAKEAEPAGEPDEPVPAGRPIGIRLARIHLRSGSLAIARAELEALAGRGVLDDDALVDLAEVRWRTGDLPGAGEAANAAIGHGQEAVVALVIAAEAVAAVGRPVEAKRLALRAMGVVDGSLDPIFAGMPRSPIWPDEPVPNADGASPAGARAGAAAIAGPASAAAAEAFAGGRAALAAGDPGRAALQLGVAIRLDPGFAAGVLAAVGDRPSSPALALVAGDALRLLGREAEAMAAFDLARAGVDADAPSLADPALDATVARPVDDGH